ncbi:MAG: hemolysin-type calcium-binding region domain protein [Candidatus Uhrbacteria bacterium GW2011_GWD2_52_7]|uniref:Hemolysin-type calcium-binding region domain protein n=1 Tax=Candidatus Uhrbacteria bacterium GW2011_GWD2_52_7 TaxID=1618989 RepID=A0A0G1XGD1_9BACT|nr:MAG: hemolysin-type calcium-binding region domain protein [Candidatus Uhrbacteria bacterium GW2011_GWD2_52_7]
MQLLRSTLALTAGFALVASAFYPMKTLYAEQIGEAVILNADGSEAARLSPFAGNPVGSVAAMDLGSDSVSEIIFGSGPGTAPTVAIYRQDGSLITSFLVYASSFVGGVNVAACDLENDGTKEIITGAQLGGGPHIRIFASDGTPKYGGFFAYDQAFRGGVNVACGDVDGDEIDDIITGPGLTGGPHIRIFDPNGQLKFEVFNGSAQENTGAFVATGNVDGDLQQEILASSMGAHAASVNIFDVKEDEIGFRSSIATSSPYGAPIFAHDLDADGVSEIGIATNGYSAAQVAMYKEVGTSVHTYAPLESTSPLRAASVIKSEGNGLVVIESTNPLNDDTATKAIRVDISDQKLTAYEHGIPVKEFLVSTGVYGFDTPLGKTDVKEKLLWHDYVWSYGVNNPLNYNIPDVKYNLRIHKHIYIHYAYWHNNFGHRMSHGCVNVNYENSEWIFNWADVGTTVNIVK